MKKTEKNQGKILLIDRYRKMFRIAENLNHYAADDLWDAERKFIQMAMKTGQHLYKKKA